MYPPVELVKSPIASWKRDITITDHADNESENLEVNLHFDRELGTSEQREIIHELQRWYYVMAGPSDATGNMRLRHMTLPAVNRDTIRFDVDIRFATKRLVAESIIGSFAEWGTLPLQSITLGLETVG